MTWTMWIAVWVIMGALVVAIRMLRSIDARLALIAEYAEPVAREHERRAKAERQRKHPTAATDRDAALLELAAERDAERAAR